MRGGPRLLISLAVTAGLCAALSARTAVAETDGDSPPPPNRRGASYVGLFVGPVIAMQWEVGETLDLSLGVQATGKYVAVDGYCGMHDLNPYGGASVGLYYSFWRKTAGGWLIGRGGYAGVVLNDFGVGVGPSVEFDGSEGPQWSLQTAQALGPARFRQLWGGGPMVWHLDFFPLLPAAGVPDICLNPPYREG